jgi:predicted dehydrogenase
MEFSNNTTATIESGFDTVRRCWIEVAGTQKALVCDDFTRSRNPDKPRFWLHEPDGESKQQVYPDKPQEQAMIEAFCNLIRQQQYDHPWLDLSLKTQFVCETLDESARTQSIVELEIA